MVRYAKLSQDHYAGIDVALEQSCVCIVDKDGEIVRETKPLPFGAECPFCDGVGSTTPTKRMVQFPRTFPRNSAF